MLTTAECCLEFNRYMKKIKPSKNIEDCRKQTWITADQSVESQKMKQVASAVTITSPTNRTGSSHQKQPQHTPLSIVLFIQEGQHVKSEAAELSTFALFNKPGWVDRTKEAGILLAGTGEGKKKTKHKLNMVKGLEKRYKQNRWREICVSASEIWCSDIPLNKLLRHEGVWNAVASCRSVIKHQAAYLRSLRYNLVCCWHHGREGRHQTALS